MLLIHWNKWSTFNNVRKILYCASSAFSMNSPRTAISVVFMTQQMNTVRQTVCLPSARQWLAGRDGHESTFQNRTQIGPSDVLHNLTQPSAVVINDASISKRCDTVAYRNYVHTSAMIIFHSYYTITKTCKILESWVLKSWSTSICVRLLLINYTGRSLVFFLKFRHKNWIQMNPQESEKSDPTQPDTSQRNSWVKRISGARC